MYFLVNPSPPNPLDVAISKFEGALVFMMWNVLGNVSCDLNSKVKGQNESPP